MSFVSLCLTSLAGLTTRCHKMAKRIIPTWRDNVLWMYLVGGKKCSHAIPTTRSPIVLFLGVLCGGVCVSLTLRLYDNSAGCLLAMKEEHMENDPWNGLLPLMFCSDHFWKIWEIYGHMWTYCQRFKSTLHFSRSFATPLGRFAALKRLKVWSMQGELGKAHASLPNWEGREHFHGAWDITTKWVGYGLTWFYMGSNSESMGYIWWNQLHILPVFLCDFLEILYGRWSTLDIFLWFSITIAPWKKQRTPWIWPGACATCPESFGQRLGN